MFSSFTYTSKLKEMQTKYDEKVAVLQKVERELILQEEKLYELQQLREDLQEKEKNLKDNLFNLESEYQILRVEAEEPKKIFKPFSKLVCNAVGNAGC